MKQLTKKQQIKNCKTFLKYWKTVPEANVFGKLAGWRSEKDKQSPHTCGTIACAGGWLPAMPEFREIGVRADANGAPVMDSIRSPWDLSIYLFGDFLFHGNSKAKSDHDEVTHRFTQQIKELRK